MLKPRARVKNFHHHIMMEQFATLTMALHHLVYDASPTSSIFNPKSSRSLQFNTSESAISRKKGINEEP
ncbi:hypothetical protein CDL12_04075 [Handroanthus impetiginosus]|uniref:Uncharacterized protein n=1 Tax=Handroanthus impetiginosus TaxID=429701 RepID=A0A2G9I0E2_9LAMI|nr:hypothetical protein CDL12_04075 [Handroanthus impetiginosus]